MLAGDYNVVPTPQDTYPTRSLDKNALIQPESRQAFARLLAQGWTNATRKLHPEGPLWTFWDYKRERWPKDKGMRLDHFLLSPEISARLVEGGVDRGVRVDQMADVLTVRVYNVRFGDAILITVPDRDPRTRKVTTRHILIDVGNAPKVASPEGVMIPFLRLL